MAKKEKEVKKFEFSKVGSILDNIAKSVPILIEKEIREKVFLTTGIYLLDAALSGKLLGGGIANNRITAFAGESGSGKSFLAYSVSKHAQKAGYSVIYIDTEQAIDLEDLPRYGIDNSLEKFRLIRSNKVEDVNILLTQLVDELKEQKLAGYEIPKLLIVLDSLGQMASNKEKADLLKGDIKQDMTKAKALGSMFRSINSDLGFLEIPLLICNHTYLTMDLYPQEKLRGGNGLLYSASVIGFMSKSKLKTTNEDHMDIQSGITVLFKTNKNRMAKPKKIKFDIPFTSGLNPYSGLEAFCRPEYFDILGIAQGKMENNKVTGDFKFVPGGLRWYIKHLDKSVTTKQLLTSEVFTPEVMKKLEPIVNDYFRFKSVEEIEEVERRFNEIIEDPEEDVDEFSDNIDAEDLFS
jgi:RecA/RadA recombinase